jgi:hypothetical protein
VLSGSTCMEVLVEGGSLDKGVNMNAASAVETNLES